MGTAHSKAKLKEAIRQNSRSISRSIRELDREAFALNRLEQQLLAQLKRRSVQHADVSQRVHARQIIRVRRRRTALVACRAQLLGARLQLQQLQSMHQLQQHLQSSALVLMKVNRTLNLPHLQRVMDGFMHESQRLGLLEEMMTDVIDGATADTEAEEEEEVISQVMGSSSSQVTSQVVAFPVVATKQLNLAACPASAELQVSENMLLQPKVLLTKEDCQPAPVHGSQFNNTALALQELSASACRENFSNVDIQIEQRLHHLSQ